MNATSIFACSVVLAIALVIFGSAGVRGTDQYWYVSDTQGLIEGNLSQTTNMYFPGKLLREGDSQTPNYFMHNGVALNIAAYIGQWFGAYRSWIIMNTLFHFIAALCVLISCVYFLKPASSAWVTVFYLLSPIAIWQTVNPLLEQSYALMTAFFVVGYIYHTRVAGLIALMFGIGLGVPSHPIFLPPSIAIILLFGWLAYSQNAKKYFFGFVASTLTLLFAYVLGTNFFPSSFQPNLQAIITSAIPGKSNMFWHYSLDQHSITLDLMLTKFKVGLQKHFLVPRFTPFYLFTNIAIILGSLLLFIRFKKLLWLILPASIFYGLYFSMIFLQQNHPRYQHIIAPVTFIIIAVYISEFKIKFPYYAKYVLLASIVTVNGFMLAISRTESRDEAIDLSGLKDQLSTVENLHSLVTFNIMPHNPVSYIIRPIPLLAIRTNMLTEDQIVESLRLFKPSHVLTEIEISDNFFEMNMDSVSSIKSQMFGTLFLYKVQKQ